MGSTKTPGSKLRAWREKQLGKDGKPMTQLELGQRLGGMDSSFVSRIERDAYKPGLMVQRLISEVTGGIVAEDDWPEPARLAERRAKARVLAG